MTVYPAFKVILNPLRFNKSIDHLRSTNMPLVWTLTL